MPRYDVVFADPTHPLAAMILEAESPGDVLAMLANHLADEPLELWCDGTMLGRLERTDCEQGPYWRLG